MSRKPRRARSVAGVADGPGGPADASARALWPTPGQEQLLRAALLDGPEALSAWDEWKRGHDLIESDLDHGSFRLLPLVYKNLLAQGADEPLMPRLKGIYRYWWCSNHRLVYRAAGVIRGLHEAEVPTVALKGLAVSSVFYRDIGARPMADIDVLVPYSRASAAVACLQRLGWKPARPRVQDLIRYQHSVTMVSATGETLDLHWHALAECVQEDVDVGFWQRATPVRILGARTLALSPSDALMHAVVHGMRWNEEPTMRWIADAMAILRSSKGAIDWRGLLAEAGERRVLLRLIMGLSYLRRTLGAPIPDTALELLRSRPHSGLERLEYRILAIGSDGTRGVRLHHLPLVLVQYLRFASGMSPRRLLAETPAYLRYRLKGRKGPIFDAVRAIRRLGRRMFASPVAARG